MIRTAVGCWQAHTGPLNVNFTLHKIMSANWRQLAASLSLAGAGLFTAACGIANFNLLAATSTPTATPTPTPTSTPTPTQTPTPTPIPLCPEGGIYERVFYVDINTKEPGLIAHSCNYEQGPPVILYEGSFDEKPDIVEMNYVPPNPNNPLGIRVTYTGLEYGTVKYKGKDIRVLFGITNFRNENCGTPKFNHKGRSFMNEDILTISIRTKDNKRIARKELFLPQNQDLPRNEDEIPSDWNRPWRYAFRDFERVVREYLGDNGMNLLYRQIKNARKIADYMCGIKDKYDPNHDLTEEEVKEYYYRSLTPTPTP